MPVFLKALIMLSVLLAVGFVVWKIFRLIKRHPTVLLGTCQLLQSPSGVFGLLTLFAITLVTLKQPSVGGIAFAAFVSVVPAILSWTEHKETMAGVNTPPPPTIMVPTSPIIVPNSPVIVPSTVVVEQPPPDPARPNNNIIIA